MAEIDAYKYWMAQIAGLSEATQLAYKLYFNQFLEYVKATPNELVEIYDQAKANTGDPREKEVIEFKLRLWLGELKKTKSVSTCRMALSSVKSFFLLNRRPLTLTRKDRPKGKSSGSRIPEKEEVIKIADAAKWKYRAGVMVLKDSGLRCSDVVTLRWENKVDMGEGFWHFKVATRKTGEVAMAFIGPESTRLLEQWKTKKGRIFKTGPDNFNDQINNLIRSAGIQDLTAHGLRKYFVTSMQTARVQEQHYLRMMGKSASVYSENRRSELFAVYKKAYPELSLYVQKQQTEELQKLKDELLELRAMVKELASKEG